MAGRRVLGGAGITFDYIGLVKETDMAYKITKACLKCGVCISGCPAGAIIPGEAITENDGLVLYPNIRIDPEKCNDCGVCVSEEWWCPARAIARA